MNEELLIYIAAKLARLDASVATLTALLLGRVRDPRLSDKEQNELQRDLFEALLGAETDHLCEQFPTSEKAIRQHHDFATKAVQTRVQEFLKKLLGSNESHQG